MEGKNMGLLIAAFVMIVVGASLIGVIADQEQQVTEKVQISRETHTLSCNESGEVNPDSVFTLTNAPSSWKTLECPIASFVLKNASGTTLTLTTDYTIAASTGIVTMKNTTTNAAAFCGAGAAGVTNSSYNDYQYCADNYITESWGRSALDLVPGFFALAMMAIGVALFFGIMKNEGLLSI